MRARNVEQLTVGREPLPTSRLQRFAGETNPYLFAARVLALHVYPEERNFNVEADWGDYMLGEEGTFGVRCVAEKDCAKPRQATYVIPIELVGAAAVAFHSEHEGHPLEMSWNGTVFHPDAKAA